MCVRLCERPCLWVWGMLLCMQLLMCMHVREHVRACISVACLTLQAAFVLRACASTKWPTAKQPFTNPRHTPIPTQTIPATSSPRFRSPTTPIEAASAGGSGASRREEQDANGASRDRPSPPVAAAAASAALPTRDSNSRTESMSPLVVIGTRANTQTHTYKYTLV